MKGWHALILWAAWLVGITLAYQSLQEPQAESKYNLGFLPVTCHLTCPVTDFITQSTGQASTFVPQRFSSWPELKESFLANKTPAAFVLAPMAIALREQGVALKIVYLGHRDGTAMMVHKDSPVQNMHDLKGKTVAVPNRLSNQFLLLFKGLADAGMSLKDVNLVELPPPDMPVALQNRSVDAVTSGEPFMARTELDGYGRVLYRTQDLWKDFISCVLVVREDLRDTDRDAVAELVAGIARSGLWLDGDDRHREVAAERVATKYYNQNPALLAYVLKRPPERVRYTDLEVRRGDFEEIERLGLAAGILKGTAHFDDYADPSFGKGLSNLTAWEYSP